MTIAGRKPKITVGVTCYNNDDNVGYLMADLRDQKLNPSSEIAEILVVASGCTDNTVSVVREQSEHDKRIRLIVEQHRNGKPSAINKILRAMTGDILVLVSGDVRLLDKYFIEDIFSQLAKDKDIIACRPLPVNDTRTTAGYIGRLIWNLHDKTLMTQVKHGLRKQAGEAFGIRREVAEEIPQNVINDDAYLVLKAQLSGARFAYARRIVVRNRTPDRIQDILLQRARIIRGHRQLRKSIGTSPSALDMLVFKQPLIVATVLLQEVREQITERRLRLFCFVELIAVEIAAHMLSAVCSFSHVWPTAQSARWHREAV